MADSIDNLPFDELIRYLNRGYYLDTFEVGSVKIDPISWPTTPRKPKQQQSDIVDDILNRPWIEPDKFTGTGFEKSLAEEGMAKKKSGSDSSPTGKGIMKTSAKNHPQSLSKKEESVSSNVKNMVKNTVSVSNSPQNQKNEEEDKKLEGTKRKLREQYEAIENEKKKRRVQFIDFVKPPSPSPVKKQQRNKPVQMIKSTRKLPSLHLIST